MSLFNLESTVGFGCQVPWLATAALHSLLDKPQRGQREPGLYNPKPADLACMCQRNRLCKKNTHWTGNLKINPESPPNKRSPAAPQNPSSTSLCLGLPPGSTGCNSAIPTERASRGADPGELPGAQDVATPQLLVARGPAHLRGAVQHCVLRVEWMALQQIQWISPQNPEV